MVKLNWTKIRTCTYSHTHIYIHMIVIELHRFTDRKKVRTKKSTKTLFFEYLALIWKNRTHATAVANANKYTHITHLLSRFFDWYSSNLALFIPQYMLILWRHKITLHIFYCKIFPPTSFVNMYIYIKSSIKKSAWWKLLSAPTTNVINFIFSSCFVISTFEMQASKLANEENWLIQSVFLSLLPFTSILLLGGAE